MLWVLHPVYAFRLFRLGVWLGVNHLPTLRQMLAERLTLGQLDPVDAIGYAFGAAGFDVHTARVWLGERGVTVTQAQLDQASAGRPRSPMPAAVPVSPAPAGTPDRAEDMHATVLAGLASGRARIAYAYSVLGELSQAKAGKWLAGYGYQASRGELSAVAKRASDPLAADSGSWPVITPTPINGHRPLSLVEG
jgi:hypothetical protein